MERARLRRTFAQRTMYPMRPTPWIWIAAGVFGLLGVVLWAGSHGASSDVAVRSAAVRDPHPITLRVTNGRPPESDGLTRFVDVCVVRDEDGKPIPDANVRFGEIRGQLTNTEGVARLPFPEMVHLTHGGLPQIIVSAPARAEVEVPAPDQDRASVPMVTVRLVARREVRVRLSGKTGEWIDPPALGFDDAALAVTLGLASTCGQVGDTFDGRGAPPYRVAPESRDGARFGWKMEVRGTDTLCLHALLGDEILAAQPLQPGTLEVSLTVDPIALARAAEAFVVLVTDGDQHAVAHARVVARLPHGAEVVRETGDDGRARFERVLATDFDLAVTADGFVAAGQRVRRPIREDVAVRLAPGRVLRGTTVDERGKPFSWAKLGLYRATQLGARTQPIATVESDAHGHFEFRASPRDALVIVALGSGDGNGYLPPRESLPATATWVEAGADAGELSVRAFVIDEGF